MNVFTLNEAFQYVDDKYLDIVEQERVHKVRRRTGSRQGLIAACIVGLILILGLPAVAIAANWFGLRELIIPQTPYSSGIETSPSEGMNTDISPEGGGDVCIGLSGYQGSAEAQALAEWQAFLADYDPDHAILNEVGNGETGVDSRYDLYYVYSQDMADKLEEIVQKYHLKLHSQINDVSQEELEYRVGGKFLPDRYDKYGAYIYENGSFRFGGNLVWDDGEMAAYQFARTVKGTFDEVILNIGNVQDFQEFSYVTAKGEAVMIAMGEDVSLICLDAESCFIAMHFLNRFSCEITKEQLMEIADDIDFALLKNVHVESPAINVMKTEMLAYGNFGGNLGQGWLFLALPDGEKRDYQVCFVRSEDEGDRYKPLEEALKEAETADYVFPDVRDGNTPIGKFVELYLYEPFAAGEKPGMVLVAIYEAGDDRYYDTRVYTEDDGGYGYAVNEFMVAELNQKYHNAEEDYPIWQVLAMPTD